jgi:aryl-alcohol dehydrogenase-like predicted oxidoreductase
MKNKIILGSANFDQIYGIKKNFIKKNEIKKLFDLALKNKIKTIDTSPLYNKSEKIIGLLNNNRFKIISKIPKPPKNIKRENIKKWLKQNVMISLKNLKIKKFECLLLHNANSLLCKNGDEIYKGIRNMKINGFTSKIGVSIYDFNVLDKILKKFKFNLIQAPFNILDQRLVEKGWLKKLKKRKIEVHARSIFLQGILLLKHNQLPKKLIKLSKKLMVWENWLKKNKFSSLQVCLSFVLNQRQLDGIVVGYNNVNQLNQILKSKQIKNNFSLPNLNIKDKKLIDPREWLN